MYRPIDVIAPNTKNREFYTFGRNTSVRRYSYHRSQYHDSSDYAQHFENWNFACIVVCTLSGSGLFANLFILLFFSTTSHYHSIHLHAQHKRKSGRKNHSFPFRNKVWSDYGFYPNFAVLTVSHVIDSESQKIAIINHKKQIYQARLFDQINELINLFIGFCGLPPDGDFENLIKYISTAENRSNR